MVNRLAGGIGILCPLERLSAIPADYIHLAGCPDNGAAAGADIFDTAVYGFLAPAFGASLYLQAAGVDTASPKVALIHASASEASVVTVQPYFACFSI